jgi:inositol polyphosphate 5-phosphatase INPP5B/F
LLNQGNKGGIAIRISFTPPIKPASENEPSTVGSPTPTILTFVNTHLAAFDDMAEKRNLDFHDLSKRLSFDNNDIPPQLPGSERENVSPGPNLDLIGTELSIYDSDVLFWMVSRLSDGNNCD